MIDIRSIKDLEKILNSDAGKQFIMNDKSIRKALDSEMQRLQRYLIEEINAYLDSYQPIQYQRTGAWLESIRVNPIQMVGNTYSISLTFDDEFAYHSSYLGNDQPDGYVPWLMEVGWDIRDKFGGRDNRFTRFEGSHYIKKAVERWNQDNKLGFTISVFRGDERYI